MIGFYNYTVVLTYLGASFAVMGMCQAMAKNTSMAMLFLMFAGVCDMFDGAVAKTRKRTVPEKNFGIQIDSLSDLICFGVLPAIIGYNLGLNKEPYHFIILTMFVLCALIRLAYFNVMEEERQKTTNEPRKYYEGLPVTNVAMLLPVIYSFRKFMEPHFATVYAVSLLVIAVLFVLRFKMIKLQMKGMLIVLVIGIVELIWFITQF